MSKYTYPAHWTVDKPEVNAGWQLFDPQLNPLTDHRGLVYFNTAEKAQKQADKLNARVALNATAPRGQWRIV